MLIFEVQISSPQNIAANLAVDADLF